MTKEVAGVLEDLRQQLAALSERIARLEAAPAPANGHAPQTPAAEAPVPTAAPPQPPKPDISEEELLAISAALGAYLGVRVHIRQIRLISSRAWAQEGRVSIQASHRLHP